MRQTEAVLLTITTTHRPATDLGHLLHQQPDRVQASRQSFDDATVLYPTAEQDRCTAALLLQVDAVRLAKSRAGGAADFSLGEYVSNRCCAASSLLAVAPGRVCSPTRCGARQVHADTEVPLDIVIPVLPCRGGPRIAQRIFEPLGWQVEAKSVPLGRDHPGGDDSRHVRLRLTGVRRLADALNQLYVLLPALDEAKHCWQGPDEVEKLLRSGGGWLPRQPEAELITRRYLGHRRPLTSAASARLAEIGGEADPAVEADGAPARTTMADQRHEAVISQLQQLGAESVVDLGCGDGRLLARLLQVPGIRRIAGSDVSVMALGRAARRLRIDEMSQRQAERITLSQGARTDEDERFAGYDAAVGMEVVERVDPVRLEARERLVFGAAKPAAVIVTTPNQEYNVRYEHLVGMRHPGHRFERTRRVRGLVRRCRRPQRLPGGPARHRGSRRLAWQPHPDGRLHPGPGRR